MELWGQGCWSLEAGPQSPLQLRNRCLLGSLDASTYEKRKLVEIARKVDVTVYKDIKRGRRKKGDRYLPSPDHGVVSCRRVGGNHAWCCWIAWSCGKIDLPAGGIERVRAYGCRVIESK